LSCLEIKSIIIINLIIILLSNAAPAMRSLLCSALFLPVFGTAFESTYDLALPPGSADNAVTSLASGRLANDGLGRVVRTGDLNGDGLADLIVASAMADVGSPVRADAGVVEIWFGRADFSGVLDAAGTAGTPPDLSILGATAGDQLSNGGALLLADLNGDGLQDLVLGAPGADGPGETRSFAGEAYIVFGKAVFPMQVDLASGGADVVVYGATAIDQLTGSGSLLAADLNGDGLQDLVLGAVGGDGPGESRSGAGEACVLFGRSTWPAMLDLALPGAGGADLIIHGANASDLLTSSGAMAAGDVNGDGVADLVLGASGGDGPGESRNGAGEVVVIFGRSNFPSTLDLASEADITLDGASASDQLSGGGALIVGDVDGDGLADLVLGAAGGDGPDDSRSGAGEAYLLRGRHAWPARLDLATDADTVIQGAGAGDGLTSGGGLLLADLDRDGRQDLILAAPLADGPGDSRTSAGEVYIVLGRSLPVALVDLAAGADVHIIGASAGDNLGINGALTAGDFNGDGFADLLLGAPLADGPGESRSNSGEAYLIFGRHRLPAVRDLALPGLAGAEVTLHGASVNDQWTAGGALAAGDLDGDGVEEILLGSFNADGPAEARSNAGETAILRGVPKPELDLLFAGVELAVDGEASLLPAAPGRERLARVQIRNSGSAELTDLTATLTDAGVFRLVAAPPASLAPGAVATLTVAFTPPDLGPWSTTLEVTGSDDDESPTRITLRAEGVPPQPPVVQTLDATAITSLGATLQGRVETGSETCTVVFDYGLTADYGETVDAAPALVGGTADVSSVLTGLQPRTWYHFRVRAGGPLGEATGTDLLFFTANRPPVAVDDLFQVIPGSTIVLEVLANDSDPDGDPLELSDFSKPRPANDGKLWHEGNRLLFRANPRFSGTRFSYTIHDGHDGFATATVTLAAPPSPGGRHAPRGGDGPALPRLVGGSFHGLVERHPFNDDLGAVLELTPAGSGAFSGSLRDGRGLLPILGAFSEATDGELLAEIALPAHAGLPALTLHLSFDAETDTLTGDLSAPGGESAGLQAWRRPLDTVAAAELAGCHAFALLQDDPGQVQGAGLYQVSPDLGAWGAGRLADGSTFTTGTIVGPQGQLLLYQPLHANRGSLAGVLHLESAPAEGATLSGEATWYLAPSPGRGKSAEPGFGPLPLQATSVEP
jgi:hypothetical protein